MREVEIFQVDAFTKDPFLGNPAGVVLDADDLTSEMRQCIAREMNCSETVFVVHLGEHHYDFRYYTPATEVDLCGHATIAALHLLREWSEVIGDLLVETNVGRLRMRIEDSGMVWMEQAKPQFRDLEQVEKAQILEALGMSANDVARELPFAMASTGLWQVMVPVASRRTLLALEPRIDQLGVVSRQLGAACVHLYARDPVAPESAAHTRDFAPAVGVAEDPHTGTATGALAALLVHRGITEPGRHVFEQGWSVKRPGHIWAEINSTDLSSVWVGGEAVTVLRGEMRLTR
ncbi:phenazine biosynthesis protein PhzF family [Alicyclobacillus hesperidum URH17-3-68]|uniref:PhzF family phenazine biosynthesis protein n=1 Tax=Alicyclobacillus hesperidum TaxID=89784 RepID=UPI000281C316|nr:PhzF family phenazine biosynthesis protein [Alicyclobacillus hesperidum]EJY94482.1 phenazine biosynthesis protein PhzF family [Alicyclobacillus hesperidum URH17-3-68]